MLTKIYYWIHRFSSSPGERGEHSSGYWQNRIRKETLKLCKCLSGRVLEIGCGEGLFLTQLASQSPDLEVFGVDNDSQRLILAERRSQEKNLKNINLSLQDAKSLFFEDEYFDAVICINFLLNLDSIEAVRYILSSMQRVSKKSGRLIFEFRNSLNPLLKFKYRMAKYYDYTVKDQPLRTYYPKQIEYILKDLNLEIINQRFIGFIFKQFAPIVIIEAQKVC